MTLTFRIHPGEHVPIYEQLAAQVRAAIARGELKPGDRLPSVRDLAGQLLVNPNTVVRTYMELEHSGVLETRRGLGTFVREDLPAPRMEDTRETIAASVDRLVREARAHGLDDREILDLVRERLRTREEDRT